MIWDYLCRDKNPEYREFVSRVAKEVYNELSEEEKTYIFEHPSSLQYHFTLGLRIRNQYIHGKELGFRCWDPDDLSGEVLTRIASLIIDDYDYENYFYRYIYDNESFDYLRRIYHAVTGKYPNEILAKYANYGGGEYVEQEVKKEILSVISNEEEFRELSEKYGLTEDEYQEYKDFVEDNNKNRWRIIPYNIALLGSPLLEGELRSRWLHVLQIILDEDPELTLEIPTLVFKQKDTVLLAVKAFGESIQRFEKFHGDEEVVRMALSSNYGNALTMDCMIPYRDR